MSGFEEGYFFVVVTMFIMFFLISVSDRLFSKKDVSDRKDFDERQEIVRSKGYRYAFYILMCYTFFKMLWDIARKAGEEHIILGFGAVCLAFVAHASYSVWNDGYFPLKKNPKGGIAMLFVLAASEVIFGAAELLNGYSMNRKIEEAVSGGAAAEELSELLDSRFQPLWPVCSLMFGFSVFVIAAAALVRFIYNRKMEGTEE